MGEKRKVQANESKDVLIVRISLLFLLSEKFICWRIWTADRVLPIVPYLKFMDLGAPWFHLVLFILSVLGILICFVTKNRVFIQILLITELLSCLLDQNRMQPWEYQFCFILLAYLGNKNRPGGFLAAVAFMLACTYFYSGLSKLNPNFTDVFWAKIVLRQFFKVPATFVVKGWVHEAGYLLGLIETLAGLALLFPSTRRIAAVTLIAMHLFILWLLGPLGLGGHKSLWPWNGAMMVILFILFIYRAPRLRVFPSLWPGANKLVLLCWGILPILSFFGCWDKYLSSNMYSANVPRMIICIDDTTKTRPLRKFYNYKKNDAYLFCAGQASLDLQDWAIRETRASVSPEFRVYKVIGEKLKKQYPGAGFNFVYFDR